MLRILAKERIADASDVARDSYGPVEERHEPASRSYGRLTFESTTTIRPTVSVVRYENREIHSAGT